MGGFHHIGLSQPSAVAVEAIVIPMGEGISCGVSGRSGFNWCDFYSKPPL